LSHCRGRATASGIAGHGGTTRQGGRWRRTRRTCGIQLFGRGAVALLDTSCDTSIIGARLLPDGADVRPTMHTLLAANGTSVPLEGEYNVHFWVAGREFNICAVVTKSVHEFILGIDFLSENACRWDFGTGYIRMGDLWVHLHQHSTEPEHRYVFSSDECVVAPCTQVEVLVDVSRTTWQSTNCDSWVTDSLEIADGWWRRGHYLGMKISILLCGCSTLRTDHTN